MTSDTRRRAFLVTPCRVDIPRNLTERQRELLEEFAVAGEESTAKTVD